MGKDMQSLQVIQLAVLNSHSTVKMFSRKENIRVHSNGKHQVSQIARNNGSAEMINFVSELQILQNFEHLLCLIFKAGYSSSVSLKILIYIS